MSDKYCRGCGSVLQSREPAAPGYVPETIGQSKERLICQRCYKMIHYGQAGSLRPDPDLIRQHIRRAIGQSELLVLVADFADLTGTLPVWKDILGNKPYILVLNKIDLLPSRTKLEEVLDYCKNYLTKWQFPHPEGIVAASGHKELGMAIISKLLKAGSGERTKIAFLGATNVGKSSLIKQMLQADGSPHTPTVSKFPGTTLALSNWDIFRGRNTLIDTPGLVPEDRLIDKLCPECAGRLVNSTTEIAQKLWGLKPGKALLCGGLAGLINLGSASVRPDPDNGENVFIGFTAPGFVMHRTDAERVDELLATGPQWLGEICTGCRQKLNWRVAEMEMEPGQDLAIAGMGWFSLRGRAARLQLTLPSGVRFEVRPALIGKR
ncbi:MAG TPA: GTPase [Bacillota bacterium]